ncbi:MAG: hypothetical protein L0229_28605 [Blastocatellia bacterium]|nr:hypothetical protein [Blastocatellia bacterium]
MKECPSCQRSYPDTNRFCPVDGETLVRPAQKKEDFFHQKEDSFHQVDAHEEMENQRSIPAPAEPLPMRLTIIDQGDEGHRSRIIDGLVLDTGRQGMRIQTGTVETGHLNIIRDHTIAFKNRLEIEVDLPSATITCTGFASWFKPVGNGVNWTVGVYIRDMSAADRQTYDEYLKELSGEEESASAAAEQQAG